jgi:hypothetical protein
MSVAEAVFGRIAGGALVIIGGGTGTQLQAEGVPMDGAGVERPGGPGAARRDAARPPGVHQGRRRGDHREHVRVRPCGPGARRARQPRRRGQPQRRPRGPAAREAAATGPVAAAGSMSSFSPDDMQAGGLGRPPPGPGCRPGPASARSAARTGPSAPLPEPGDGDSAADLLSAVLAENLIRAGQALCRYSWRMPPGPSRRWTADRHTPTPGR